MSAKNNTYLSRNPHTGHIETIGQAEQTHRIAKERYGLTLADLDKAAREYERGRLAALKRVIFG